MKEASLELFKRERKNNAILINTTNSKMKKYENVKAIVRLGGKMLFFFDKNDNIILKTSLLVSHKKKDNIITFKTLNSEYTFKILDEVVIDEKNFATDEELKTLSFTEAERQNE